MGDLPVKVIDLSGGFEEFARGAIAPDRIRRGPVQQRDLDLAALAGDAADGGEFRRVTRKIEMDRI